MKNPAETAEFFIQLNEFDSAKIVLDLLKPHATTIESLNQLGELYSKIREFRETLELGHKLYDLVTEPTSKFDARTNIIRSYLNLNQPELALNYILINEQERPQDQPTQMDKAMALFFLNEKDRGEHILRSIINNPQTKDIESRAKFNLGNHNLRKGNFKEGLHQILVEGRALMPWGENNFPAQQYWRGTAQQGKTIALIGEGGIGDEIISIRFMRHIKQLGMNPIWITDRQDLADVFERCGFASSTRPDQLPIDWLWTHSMPVPCYLNIDETELWHGPYLTAQKNKPILEGAKKIGIKTSGNPKYDQDLHRTIPLNELIACIPDDYTIYSFHIDETIDHPRVRSLKDCIDSWDDTLDYIDQMDIVISSCTSLIHAAGALGKRSIVLVPILTYYTWAGLGTRSKWYGENLSVIRQTEYDNWATPLQELSLIFNEHQKACN